MAKHSSYGGSSASRWTNCPGSVALIETVPAKPSSVYAEEGLAAHHLAATCLQQDLHPTHFLGEAFPEYPSFPVTQEMCDAVVVYLNAVTAEVAKTKTAQLYVEQGFVLDVPSADPGEVFGTNDAMVYHPKTGRLVVFDYKHGVGVSVSAKDNAQLKFYAAGAVFANQWKLSEVVLVIVQPRSRDVTDGIAEAVREWPMDTLELLEFKEEVDTAIERAKSYTHDVIEELFSPEGVTDVTLFKTGTHCRWCDAAAVCPARQAEILDAAGLAFKDVAMITTEDLPDPSTFDAARLGKLFAAGDLLNAWLNQCREYMEAIMMGGQEVPGYKVVEKIGRAKWTSDEEAIAAECEMLFDLDENLIRPRKLATIGDVEKLLKAAGAKKDEVDTFKLKHTIKESSGLTIAPDSDRRPAVNAAERAFGDVQI